MFFANSKYFDTYNILGHALLKDEGDGWVCFYGNIVMDSQSVCKLIIDELPLKD